MEDDIDYNDLIDRLDAILFNEASITQEEREGIIEDLVTSWRAQNKM